jgi:hypothetical protein
MKTPKEKAAELIDKFTYWNTSEAEREGIKSALHCVAEIIGVKLLWFQKDTKEIEYWQEVRNEIDKINNL